MAELKDLIDRQRLPCMACTYAGYHVVLVEVTVEDDFALYVDDAYIRVWHGRSLTRQELDTGVHLPSGETMRVPDGYDGWQSCR